jgi:hypothetical protein
MALSPNVPTVAPGDLITAAHHNNVRANLDRLDTTKLALAGGVMTGTVQVGADPATLAAGTIIRTDGVISSRAVQPTGLTTPSLTLDRAGTPTGDVTSQLVAFRRSATAGGVSALIGSIAIVTGPGVAYNTTSDGRLKDVVGDIDDPVGTVAALHPRRLVWLDDPDEVEFDGFIAQEVADVVPGAVTGDPDGDPRQAPLQLDVTRLIPVLVAAVQELTARVAVLEAGG